MKGILLLFVFIGIGLIGSSQAVFRSSGSSTDWALTSSWTLVSGSDGDQIPDSDDDVFVQVTHTIILNANQSCNNLNVSFGSSTDNTVDGVLNLQSFVLNVNGYLRGYTADIGMTPGSSSTAIANGNIIKTGGTSGRLRFVGATKTIIATNEWSASHTGQATTYGLEISMDFGATATIQVNVKASTWTISSGTLEMGSNVISVDNGTTGSGDVTVSLGATLSSATSSASDPIIRRTTTTSGGSFALNGTLKLSGESPRLAMTSVDFTVGTVEYINNTGTQTFLSGALSGVTPIVYNNVTLTTSGGGTTRIKRLPASTNITVNGFLTLKDKATLDVPSGSTLTYGSSATLNYDWATVFTQDDEWPTPTPTVTNVVIGSGGVTFPGTNTQTRALTGAITLNGTLTITSGASLTLKSSSSKTARIAPITTTGASIVGSVIVERFIPANSTRAWRLMAIPTTTTQSFKTSWQENQPAGTVGTNNLGTNLTSSRATWSADGFDYQTSGNALLEYVPASNTWTDVTATTNTIATNKGWMVFIRGDRSATPANSTITSTVLRTTGTAKQGTFTSTVAADQFDVVGNPYASEIDLTLLAKAGGMQDVFYLWDPKLTGSYGLGGYQTLTRNGTTYDVTPGGGSYGATEKLIPSGMAFFAHSTGASGTLTFNESSKSTGTTNNGFSPLSGNDEHVAIKLFATNGSPRLADGALVRYDALFSNSVDGEDAKKLSGFGESMGMRRDGNVLAVEKRINITSTDTIYLNTANLRLITYQLQVIINNMDQSGLVGFLQDKFLNTSTSLNLNGTNTLDFSVTADPQSYAADRFKIVFQPVNVVPVTFTNVKAYTQGSAIVVEWKVENERGIAEYVVERSSDGISFAVMNTKPATSTGVYNSVDNNPSTNNYYRIKSVGVSGQIMYSAIVRVTKIQKGSFVVSPNPVSGSRINLGIEAMPAGSYDLRLINNIGQTVVEKNINYHGGSVVESIEIAGLQKGIYQLIIENKNTRQILKVIKN